MKEFYSLLITYPHSGQQHILSTQEKAVVAHEENKHLLLEMGRKLLDDGVISSYTLMKSISPEINRYNKDVEPEFYPQQLTHL